MHTAEFYRKKAEQAAAAAKIATLNEDKAREYARAEHYMRLALDKLQPTERRRKGARPSAVSI
jgi:hypothetical protein